MNVSDANSFLGYTIILILSQSWGDDIDKPGFAFGLKADGKRCFSLQSFNEVSPNKFQNSKRNLLKGNVSSIFQVQINDGIKNDVKMPT